LLARIAVRIVSLLSSATEILFAIGAGDDVHAISHECDFTPEATTRPRATRSCIDSSRPSQEIDDQVKRLLAAGEPLYEIDRELILDLKPDLIVTQAQCDVCAVRYQDVIDFVLAEPLLARTQVLALNPQSVSQILDDVLRLGKQTDRTAAAVRFHDQLLARYTHITAVASRQLPQSRLRPRVVVIEWTEPLMSAANWTPELVQAAGGEPLLSTAGQHSPYIGWSQVVDSKPDVLIVAPCGFDLQRSQLEARRLAELPGYQELPAVVHRRAFAIDGNAYLNRSGPRIIDSLEILAHLIRPELFSLPLGDLAEGRAWSRLHAG
jgi:iron complex transport system substrate-binding protein